MTRRNIIRNSGAVLGLSAALLAGCSESDPETLQMAAVNEVDIDNERLAELVVGMQIPEAIFFGLGAGAACHGAKIALVDEPNFIELTPAEGEQEWHLNDTITRAFEEMGIADPSIRRHEGAMRALAGIAYRGAETVIEDPSLCNYSVIA